MADLWASQPKQLRAIWGNVNGERMWYAVHGYDLHAMPTVRGMFGHGRVLPPNWRGIDQARGCSRLLLTKAASGPFGTDLKRACSAAPITYS
jgi:DNA polymerase-4